MSPIWVMLFHVFFCKIIKVHRSKFKVYRFIILLHLISSCSLARSLLVPYADVSIKSIDCILLSSFELKAILLISSVKTLCFSLLNLCFVFSINLLFITNSLCLLLQQKKLSMSILFFLDNLFYFQAEFVPNSCYNF